MSILTESPSLHDVWTLAQAYVTIDCIIPLARSYASPVGPMGHFHRQTLARNHIREYNIL